MAVRSFSSPVDRNCAAISQPLWPTALCSSPYFRVINSRDLQSKEILIFAKTFPDLLLSDLQQYPLSMPFGARNLPGSFPLEYFFYPGLCLPRKRRDSRQTLDSDRSQFHYFSGEMRDGCIKAKPSGSLSNNNDKPSLWTRFGSQFRMRPADDDEPQYTTTPVFLFDILNSVRLTAFKGLVVCVNGYSSRGCDYRAPGKCHVYRCVGYAMEEQYIICYWQFR